MRANRFSMHLSVDVVNLEALLAGREGAAALMLDLRYTVSSQFTKLGARYTSYIKDAVRA